MGWVLLDSETQKLSTSYHVTFDEDVASRRCALRDFDLRQTKKAGPGATADEEREAKPERPLYDESPDLKYGDRIVDFEGDEGQQHRVERDDHEDSDGAAAETEGSDPGAEEAYW